MPYNWTSMDTFDLRIFEYSQKAIEANVTNMSITTTKKNITETIYREFLAIILRCGKTSWLCCDFSLNNVMH